MVHSFYSSAQPSGENVVVLNEVDALRRAGHEVALFAAHTDELEGEVFYKLRSGLRVATGYGRNPLKAIKDFSPDVVHVHNLFPNLGSSWLEGLAAPTVRTLHNFRHVCAAGTLFRDGAICTRCVEGGPRHGVLHRCYRGSRLATVPLALRQAGASLRDPGITSASTIIVFSPVAAALLRDRGADSSTITIWPNFVPAPAERDGSQSPANQSRSGWLYVGRLSAEKGILRLLSTWPRGETLRVVGSGPQFEDARQLAAGRAVELLGTTSAESVRRHMESATGLLIPSECYENFPLVYAEALRSGTPVIAWQPNVVASLAEEEATGLPARWENPVEDHLQRLLDLETLRPKLRDHCREVYRRRYTEHSYVERAQALYTRVASSRSLSRTTDRAGRTSKASGLGTSSSLEG
jgi:glycosyltransferase involved in cell wall biosynthesis